MTGLPVAPYKFTVKSSPLVHWVLFTLGLVTGFGLFLGFVSAVILALASQSGKPRRNCP